MDSSIVPSKTCVFKVNCQKCQKKVKKLLSRQKGVYTIDVEGEGERVIMKSSVNPNKPAATIGEATKEQEGQAVKPPPNEKENNNHKPIEACVCQSRFKGFEGADLQELAKTNKLKQLEFTQNLRMTFNEGKDDNGASQKGCDHKGFPSEPKKDNDQNHFVGTNINASIHESREATGSTHLGRGVNTPPPHHHPLPPYHGYNYTPLAHHNYPPPPNANKNCDSASRCNIL